MFEQPNAYITYYIEYVLILYCYCFFMITIILFALFIYLLLDFECMYSISLKSEEKRQQQIMIFIVPNLLYRVWLLSGRVWKRDLFQHHQYKIYVHNYKKKVKTQNK